MRRLIYISSGKRDFSTCELADILEQSQRNNARDAITGLLAYHDGCFFQSFEGPAPSVQALLDRIREDTRNSNVLILSDSQVKTRVFPDWHMALVPRAELGHLVAQGGLCLKHLSEKASQLTQDRRVNILFASFLKCFREIEVR